MTQNKPASKRILSVDALRGFDMLLIIFADRFFWNLHDASQSNISGFFSQQFSHPEWYGFHFYDIIMPLFLFVVGVVIPFSLSKRKQQVRTNKSIYGHLIRRFIILFILGWIVQGNLLAWDIEQFHFFSNTLQAIAVGYLVSSVAYMHLSQNMRYVLFASCLIVYAILLSFAPVPGVGQSQLLPDKNIAVYLDRLILGPFDDGLQYTWLLTGFGFTATTLSGLFAGELLRSKMSRIRITQYLFLIGLTAFAAGMIWGIWHPIVKKLWTSSFVLFSSGICFMLLALFYWIIDVKGYQRWARPLKIIGMNAITAYVLSHVIDFGEIAHFLTYGLKQYTGAYYGVITATSGFFVLYALLWYLYKNQDFIKV